MFWHVDIVANQEERAGAAFPLSALYSSRFTNNTRERERDGLRGDIWILWILLDTASSFISPAQASVLAVD